MERCAVIDDDGDEFEDVDGDELAVIVVFLEKQGSLFDFVGKVYVPPESQLD